MQEPLKTMTMKTMQIECTASYYCVSRAVQSYANAVCRSVFLVEGKKYRDSVHMKMRFVPRRCRKTFLCGVVLTVFVSMGIFSVVLDLHHPTVNEKAKSK